VQWTMQKVLKHSYFTGLKKVYF